MRHEGALAESQEFGTRATQWYREPPVLSHLSYECGSNGPPFFGYPAFVRFSRWSHCVPKRPASLPCAREPHHQNREQLNYGDQGRERGEYVGTVQHRISLRPIR